MHGKHQSAFQTKSIDETWHLNAFTFPQSFIQNSPARCRILFNLFTSSMLHQKKNWQKKRTHFKRFTTICWHTCRCGNPIQSKPLGDSLYFIFVYIFFLASWSCVYFFLFSHCFHFRLCLFRSFKIEWTDCMPTQQHAKCLKSAIRSICVVSYCLVIRTTDLEFCSSFWVILLPFLHVMFSMNHVSSSLLFAMRTHSSANRRTQQKYKQMPQQSS